MHYMRYEEGLSVAWDGIGCVRRCRRSSRMLIALARLPVSRTRSLLLVGSLLWEVTYADRSTRAGRPSPVASKEGFGGRNTPM
jgi:hypothetical protein